VVIGSALAIADKNFVWLPAVAAFSVALLLQIGVNLANDYFDYLKGIDTADRLGPLRVTQSGLIPATQVKAGMIMTFILSMIPGIYLLTVGGLPVFIIGVACICAALAYSGGPYPLASHGLGDLFVFIFFGLVAVCGTYYVQALQLTPMVLLMGVIAGLLITAILVVNNLRDIQSDRQTGKRTLAVIIGIRGSRIEYVLLLAAAYAIPIRIQNRVCPAVSRCIRHTHNFMVQRSDVSMGAFAANLHADSSLFNAPYLEKSRRPHIKSSSCKNRQARACL
jgi:1,4-dihydroxy-2-naphthoate octaprenyltransferase